MPTGFAAALVPHLTKSALSAVWGVALLLSGAIPAALLAADKPTGGAIQFTGEEVAWLKANPVIRLGLYRPGWPPFDIVTEQDQYRGISADYVYLLEKRLGFKAQVIIFSDWGKALSKLQTREIDFVTSFTKTPERENRFKFSKSYLDVPNISVRRKGWTGDQHSPDLAGLRIAIEKGYASFDFVKRIYPAAEHVVVSDTLSALTSVAENRADIYFGNLAVAAYLIDKYYLSNLTIGNAAPFKTGEMRFGVRYDWPIFARLLDKGLDDIGEDEARKIRERWIPHANDVAAFKLEFSARERRWLSQHPIIRVGSETDYAPFSFLSDGEYRGLAVDYLKLAAKHLGVTIEFSPNLTWGELLQAARDRRVDLLTSVAKTPSRGEYLAFSAPLLVMPAVIVTNGAHGMIHSLEDLNGKSVALVKDFAVTEAIQREHPRVAVRLCASDSECVDLVAQGKAVATVGDLSVLGPLIQARYAGQLKINNTAPAFDINQSFGVRKDWPELTQMLDKVLARLPAEDHDRIRQKWLSVQYRQGVEWRNILRVALPIALVVITALTFSLLWNQKLQAEIRTRKRTEAALATAKEQAEAATAAKSEFLAAMSHEIRTPMNSVIGLVELLSRTQLSAEQRRNLSVIDDSANALLHVINDILDFSKIEAGRLTLEPTSIDLGRLAQSVIRMFAQSARQKNLALTADIDPNLAQAVLADGVRIQQILFNLVGNAIKFTRHGHVTLKVRVLKDDAEQQRLRFEVSDTGIGIAKENQEKLFQAFTQAETSTTRRFGGTGLGLAISKRLADLMQGTLTIESDVGVGTTVHFDIALRKMPAPASSNAEADAKAFEHHADVNSAKPPSREQAVSSWRLILVVDDHPTNRLVIHQQLSLLGYRADIFDNAAEALSAWASGNYGLVLTDCFMPGMDGYTLARRIRQQETERNLSRTPIVAFSAAVLSGEQERSLASGMDDFLAKPADLNAIARKLEKWLPQTNGHGRTLDDHRDEVASAATASGAIDIDVLMASFGNLETSRSILQHYLVSYREDVTQLARAMEEQDHGAIERIAHRMKGAARTVGAKAHAAWCVELEMAGRNGDERRVRELWRGFEAMDAEIEDGIAAMSYSHPPA